MKINYTDFKFREFSSEFGVVLDSEDCQASGNE